MYFAKLLTKDAFSLLNIEMNFNENAEQKHLNFAMAININKETGGELMFNEDTQNLVLLTDRAELCDILLNEELKELNPYSTIGLNITHYTARQLVEQFGGENRLMVLKDYLEQLGEE
jgi:hypothetical protein